ncbi:MAG TPA: zf-HC2 domain-containing protein [Pyrinomonadaceae bacterium]|nr:zf-HC2 domain-containing protein [Pyrinomonadaceae bacterium]
MTCDQTQKISQLIDGELTASERTSIEQHLHDCIDCRQAHEAFLNLRTEILAYTPSLAPSASDAALAKILSAKPKTPADRPAVSRTRGVAKAPAWRNPLPALFESFTPRLAAVAALIAIAVTIGAITFFSLRSPDNLASNNASTPDAPAKTVDGPSNAGAPTPDEPVDLSEATAQSKSKGTKGRQPGRAKPTENRRLKPEGERTAPVQPPRPQVGVPPTYATVEEPAESPLQPSDSPLRLDPSDSQLRLAGAEMLTARHLEQSELLLRSFRNARPSKPGSAPGIAYDRRRARQLLYQNIRLRREADDTGDVEVASLLSSLEPILLDIANLRDKPDTDEITAIRDRVERKNLVALLQVNSTTVARAYE